MTDYYAILGLPRNATQEEIEIAYNYEAKKWNPATNTSPDAKQRFDLINEAYNVLTNADKKREHDEQLANNKVAPKLEKSGGGGMSAGRIAITVILVILLLFRVARLINRIDRSSSRSSSNYDRYEHDMDIATRRVPDMAARRNLRDLYSFDVDSFAKKIKIKPGKRNQDKKAKSPIIVYEKNTNVFSFNTGAAEFLKYWILTPISRDSINTIVVFEHLETEIDNGNDVKVDTKILYLDGRTFAVLKETILPNNNRSANVVKWHLQNDF